MKVYIEKINWLIYIYFIIFVIQEILPNFQVVGQAINIVYGMILFILIIKNRINFKFNAYIKVLITMIIILFLFFGSLSYLYNNNGGPSIFLKVFSPLIISAIIYYGKVSSRVSNNLFYVITLIIAIKWMIVQDENNIFNSSRNMISLFFIFMTCLDIFLREKNNERQDFFKIIITLFFSILSKGRSGIVIAIALLFLNIIYYILKKGSISKFKLYISILILILFFYLSLDIIDTYLESFNRYGMESIRFDYWYIYVNSMFKNIFNFFLGSNLKNFSILQVVDYNLHNSFFMSHANYGIFIFISIIIISFRALFKALKNKHYSILFIIFFIFSKGNIDYIFFHSFSDVLVFILLFYVADLKKLKLRLSL